MNGSGGQAWRRLAICRVAEWHSARGGRFADHRSMLGLNVHEEEVARLASIGIDEKLAKSDHYLVIGLEYIIRIIYAGLLLALLLLCTILVWKDKLMSLASTFFICLLGFLLFGSGLIHTNPRHTTIALPILLFILCILCRTRISLAQKVERPDY